MKYLKKENEWTSTLLAFILIPLSGFAMDVYIPSFPEMVKDLHTSADNVRLTMTIYLISYGISQLFIGTIIDSFGRYRLSLIALFVFALSNFIIVVTSSIEVIFLMRTIQGLAISIIIIAKRSFFIDVYTGSKQKHYTSLLTIVWSSAPILAPFFGAYLQNFFGWRANFSFLGFYALILLVLELKWSGETLKSPKPFKFKPILAVYKEFMMRRDYSFGIIVLGLSYAIVIIFGMAAPFIIEQTFHLSAITTGYSALISGIAILLGGFLSKYLINKPFYKKLIWGSLVQCLLVVLMFLIANFTHSIITLMSFVFFIHLLMGFLYGVYFTYCITRFPSNAGMAGGVTSGGSYIITSLTSYVIVKTIDIKEQSTLAIGYFILAVAIMIVMLAAKKHIVRQQNLKS